MLIGLYYLLAIVYTYLLSLLVNVDYTNLANVWLYVSLLGLFILSILLSFATVIFIIYLLGLIRTKSDYKNKLNHTLANAILRLGLHLMRVKVIVTGKENIPEENFVLVANHQENYDIIILKPIFKDHIINFIAKEALTRLPIFGRWISLLGNVFISREADRSAAESIIKGIRNYKDGISMGIFPEGKRAFGNEMIAFKPGAFKLAMKPKAPLLVATQYNVCKIFKSVPWKRYRVYVHIHPVIMPEDYEGKKSQEISVEVKEMIQSQLDEFKRLYN